MSEYKKTALVLGAGGFIESHMVKRLRSEGYWVRGVDLKHTEFSKSEANEFVVGDLRDIDFVHRAIKFKGVRENFYHDVPERYIETFDEIYQLLLIWVVQVSFSLVKTTQTLCIIRSN